MLPVKLFCARAGLGAATPPAQRITRHPLSDCERRRGFLPPARGRQLKCLRVSSFEPKCLRISSRRVPPGSDPHARPPKSPPLPSPEALRTEVDSQQWAGRAGAEISPRPRRRGRPAGVAIPPPPESNFPPGGAAPGRGLSSAPGRGLSVCPAPAPPGAVCRSVRASRGTERNAHPESRCTVASGSDNTIFNRTTAYSTYYGHASVAHHRMYHRQHLRQQSAPSSATSPSFRSHFSWREPVRLVAYCARGRAARAPAAARAHGVATKAATPRNREA